MAQWCVAHRTHASYAVGGELACLWLSGVWLTGHMHPMLWEVNLPACGSVVCDSRTLASYAVGGELACLWLSGV